MSEKVPQNFANHAKIVPHYHFFTFGILLINLGWAIWQLWKAPALGAGVALLLAVALIFMFFQLRIFPLSVQDRVIRLEMRLRLREVLPEDLRARIPEIGAKQLVALRFASDPELPGLVREVLDQGLRDGKAIKQKIKNWQADHLRL